MIAKSAVSSAMELIAARRAEALAHAEELRTEIYAALPELYEVDAEFFRLLSGSAPAEGLSALHERKIALLASGGFSESDLLPRYSCKLCEDTGFVEGRRCECLSRLIKAQAGRSLPAGLASRCSFDNIDTQFYPPEGEKGRSPREIMSGVIRACREYAEAFSPRSDSLLFIGAPGLGKTHLSVAIARRVLERGYGVLYTSAQPLMDAFERIRFDRAASDADRELTVLSADIDLLILDDLGAEFVTPFSQSSLYNVINGRLVCGLPTIISTNLMPAEIAKTYTQRIASRILYDYKPYVFAGRDVRLARNR